MTRMSPEWHLDSLRERLSLRSYFRGSCLIWDGPVNERGYGFIRGDRKTILTHRAAWLVYYGSLPKQLVLHNCDVRACINVFHLRQGTPQDNADDKMKRNRYRMPTHYKGSENGNAILTEELVVKIKASLKEGKRVSEVSRIFDQPFTRIYDIKRGRTWMHIKD